ncbi:MAG: nicotinate-nucleotide adenylyltransferase [Bacteroidota bacterium]
MRKLILGLFVLGLTIQAFAQVVKDETLSEVVVYAVNYKYLDNVGDKDLDVDVNMLERKVANYDLKGSELYTDEYDIYTVSFFIPDGKIVAAYDKDGRVIRTIEKFKDVKPPADVTKAIVKRFPGWAISKDVYLVKYHQDKGVKKVYKFTLVNGDKKMKVKTDEKGNFV